MLFDYSENIRPYYQVNEKLPENEVAFIQSSYQNDLIEDNEEINTSTQKQKQQKLSVYYSQQPENNFLSMMYDLNNDETTTNKCPSNKATNNIKENDNNYIDNSITPTKKNWNDILSLSDEELYNYLDLENSVKNWNDFLQPRYPSNSINSINNLDVELKSRTSYIKGKDFFIDRNFQSMYYEQFEDNFRKQLEECDKLEVLNLNIDINTFWGGISNYFLESIHEMLPKVIKVVNAVDNDSSFYSNQSEFDIEKYANYIWYISDALDVEGSNIWFNPLHQYQTPSIIQDVFGYQYQKWYDDPVHTYYNTAWAALSLQSLYIPLRSKYYNKSTYLTNLHLNSCSLNVIENDCFFQLDNNTSTTDNGWKSNGYLHNFQRNYKHKDFSWKKLWDKSIRFNKYSSSIVFGNNSDYQIFNQTYNVYLDKLSQTLFCSEEKLKLPISFPRKYSNVFIKEMTCLNNYRPNFDFALQTFKNFKKEYKEKDIKMKKYLNGVDKDKYYDYKDKCENIFNMIYSYRDYAEGLWDEFNHGNESEEDEYDI